MTYIGVKNYNLEVKRGFIDGVSIYNKFGANTDVDTGTTPEDLWGGSGLYTGFNATSGEAIETLSSNGNDAGTVLSSGTATGGSATTLVDSGATFVTNGVAVGDCIINDTQKFHGIVSAVTSETTLTVVRFEYEGDPETTYSFANGNTYRVASAGANTGCFVLLHTKMIESDYASYIREYIVMNGGTPVDTSGADYIRSSRTVCIAFGSGGTAAGVIQSRQTTTTANVFTWIPTGHNQSLVAADTVPAGHTLYISALICKMGRATGAAGSAEVDFLARPLSQGFNSKIHQYITDKQGFEVDGDYMLALPEYTDYKWQCQEVSDNNTQISAEINGFLIQNGS